MVGRAHYDSHDSPATPRSTMVYLAELAMALTCRNGELALVFIFEFRIFFGLRLTIVTRTRSQGPELGLGTYQTTYDARRQAPCPHEAAQMLLRRKARVLAADIVLKISPVTSPRVRAAGAS